MGWKWHIKRPISIQIHTLRRTHTQTHRVWVCKPECRSLPFTANDNKHDYSISHESLMYTQHIRYGIVWYGLIQIEWFCFGISTILHVLHWAICSGTNRFFFLIFTFSRYTCIHFRKGRKRESALMCVNEAIRKKRLGCYGGIKHVVFFTFSCAFNGYRQFEPILSHFSWFAEDFWPSINRSTILLPMSLNTYVNTHEYWKFTSFARNFR